MVSDVNLSFWDFLLGSVTFISFGLVLFQHHKQRIVRNSANAIYSQLYNIVDEIDRERIVEVSQAKIAINQVRISCIGMNKALGVPESVHKPYDYALEERREKQIRDMKWKKTKKELE